MKIVQKVLSSENYVKFLPSYFRSTQFKFLFLSIPYYSQVTQSFALLISEVISLISKDYFGFS